MRAIGKAVDQKTPDMRISYEKVKEIRQQKGVLTFRPASRGKLVCNQLPELGRIGKKQAETLRRQLWPKNHTARSGNKIIRAALYTNGDVQCGYCGGWTNFPGAYGLKALEIFCLHCYNHQATYKVV